MKWVDLSSRARFRLSGPDRVRYLNGQVSNQIDQDLSGKAIEACVCNLKGKIEGVITVTAKDDALLIDCDEALRDDLYTRLDRYLIADDCEFEDVTDTFQLWHGIGEDTDEGVISNRFGKTGRDVWLPAGEDFSLENEFNEDELEHMRIGFGIPKWGRELTGDEFPAEVRLDERAVDFHKGCYLGQEIVSRIKSVGKVKRSLVLLEGSDPESFKEVSPGMNLEIDGASIGKITSVSTLGGESLALAFVKRSFTDSEEERKLPLGLRFRLFQTI